MWCEDWYTTAHLAAWPESKRLKSALKDKRRGTKYTMPGIKHEICSSNDTKQDTEAFKAVDPKINKEGLLWLIDARRHFHAVEATGTILSMLGQGMDMSGRSTAVTPYSLEIWSIRFQLLLGLQKYKELLDELSSFEELDAPDLFFQYHSTDAEEKKGSLIPFAMRLVYAEALIYSPLPKTAVARVYQLITDINTVMTSLISSSSPVEHLDAWKKRLRVAVALKCRILNSLGETEHTIKELIVMKDSSEDEEEKKNLSLCLSRLSLTVCNEEAACKYLSEITSVTADEKALHSALIATFVGDNEASLELLKTTSADGKLSFANNTALALLYNGKPVEAADLLIKVAKEYQTKNLPLHPSFALNLKTISEVAYATNTKTKCMSEVKSFITL